MLGLVIFLGAFALDGKLTTPSELLRAVLLFAPILLLLLKIWFDVVSLIEQRPKCNPRFLQHCICVALAVVVLPALLKIMNSSAQALDWGSRLYAIDMAFIYLMLAYLTHRLLHLRTDLTADDRYYWRVKRGRRLLVAALLAASWFVPSLASSGLPLREVTWLLTLVIPHLYHPTPPKMAGS